MTSPPRTRGRANSLQSDVTIDAIKALIESSKSEIITSLKDDIQSLKDTIKTLVARVDTLESENKKLTVQYETLKKTIPPPSFVQESCSFIMNEMEDRQARRCNLIVRGISESTCGSSDDRIAEDREKCKDMFKTLDLDDVPIQHVMRLGKKHSGNKRLLKICLSNATDRDKALRNSRQLKETEEFSDVFLQPDMTIYQQKVHQELRKELKHARDMGHQVVIYKGRVVDRASIRGFRQ